MHFLDRTLYTQTFPSECTCSCTVAQSHDIFPIQRSIPFPKLYFEIFKNLKRAFVEIIFNKRTRWRIIQNWEKDLHACSASGVKSWGLKAESWKSRNFTIENFHRINAPNNLPRCILVALPGHPISFPCSSVRQVTGSAFQKREKNGWRRGVSIRAFVLLRAAGTRLTIAGYRTLHVNFIKPKGFARMSNLYIKREKIVIVRQTAHYVG